MEKINWINGETPINQANLNGMQNNIEKSCVAVSKTQPTTNESVWIKKGKNEFDENTLMQGTVSATDGKYSWLEITVVTDFIPISQAPYYIKLNNVNANQFIFRVNYYDENKEFLATDTDLNVTEKAIGANNAKYIRVCFGKGSWAGLTPTDIKNANVQLEQNTTATPYEPHTDKEIYVKNENGVFERFYKEVEDTNWRNLEIINGSAYSNEQTPQIRRIGKLVQIRGALKGITKIDTALVTIPDDCLPSQIHSFTCPGSGIRHNRFQLYPDRKNIIFNSNSSGEELTDTNWYPICTSYFID